MEVIRKGLLLLNKHLPMTIEKSFLEDWRKIRSRTDIKTMLAENPGTAYRQFYRALLGLECELQIFKILHEFYAAKQKQIKQILEESEAKEPVK